MPSEPIPSGQWLQLFGRPTTFKEDTRRAERIGSSIELLDISAIQPDLRYVKIIFDEIAGWEEPLWGTDDRWLYLRRPQGVWKTPLPLEHLGRVGIVYQRRGGGGTHGGTQLGRNFGGKNSWRMMFSEATPEELDEPRRFDGDGCEIGPMLLYTARGERDIVYLLGGSKFGSMPASCSLDAGYVRVVDASGQAVKFQLGPCFDMGALVAHCKMGKLWMRFGCLDHPWMDPIDIKVAFLGQVQTALAGRDFS